MRTVNKSVYNYDRISITARTVAYVRSFSNIPYAKEIAEKVSAKEAWEKIWGNGPESHEQLMLRAPGIEARGKSIDEILRRSNATQILELAAGMSPRGLAFTNTGKVTYTETDLQDISNEKRGIIESIAPNYSSRKLRLEQANALSYADILNASGAFLNKPLYIVSEGLMNHLNINEKKRVAYNVKCMLQVFGGAWICSDILDRKRLDAADTPGAKRTDITGRSVIENALDSEESVHAFFSNMGFSVEKYPIFTNLHELYSLRILGVPKTEINPLLQKSPWKYTWVFKLNQQRS